jgi:hypothetical protein
MLKISGLDKLQKQLSPAQGAFQVLDGQLATVRFDPEDRASVQAAIATREAAVDAKVAP